MGWKKDHKREPVRDWEAEERERRRSLMHDSIQEHDTVDGSELDEVSGALTRYIGLSDLLGATIDDIGKHYGVAQGGLAIDYTKDGVKKRIAFGYTELGEWIEWQGEL